MCNIQKESSKRTREEYSAPTYRLTAFETSDLITTSGEVPEPQPGAVGFFFEDVGALSSGAKSPW